MLRSLKWIKLSQQEQKETMQLVEGMRMRRSLHPSAIICGDFLYTTTMCAYSWRKVTAKFKCTAVLHTHS